MTANNRHYWFKSGSYALIMNIQGLFFGFGSFYLLVRMLSKHQFGIWALFVATTTIFDMARSGLIQNALIKFLSSHSTEKERSDIISASFFLSGVSMLVCIIINISLANYLAGLWHEESVATMFYLYNIVYVLQGILSQFQWIEQANLSFKGILITNAIKQGGFFCYVLICFVFHIKIFLVNLIYAQALFAFLGALLEYFFVKNHFSYSLKINMTWVKKLFNYGKFVFGTSISSILATTINQLTLGALLTPEAAGVFNVAGRVANLVDIPTTALSSIVFPQSAKRSVNDGKLYVKYLYEKSVGTLLALIIPFLLFLFVFPVFVIDIVAGSNYSDSSAVLQVTIVACIFNPFSLMFGTILDSVGRPKVNFIVIVLFTAVKLFLNFLLIERYGIMGAAYATLIADAIFFIVQTIILRNEFDVNPFYTLIYAIRFYPEFFNNYIKPRLRNQ